MGAPVRAPTTAIELIEALEEVFTDLVVIRESPGATTTWIEGGPHARLTTLTELLGRIIDDVRRAEGTS